MPPTTIAMPYLFSLCTLDINSFGFFFRFFFCDKHGGVTQGDRRRGWQLVLYFLISPKEELILEIRSYDCSRCGGQLALVHMLSTCFLGIESGCMDKVNVFRTLRKFK